MKLKVNTSRIDEIVGEDKSLKKTLMQLFLETCNRVVMKLETSLFTDDSKLWKDASHELKGAALNLGFEELSSLCLKMEKTEMDINQKKESVEVLKTVGDSVRDIVSKL
jgi:HPt (histidine-containing phosphotransfer) domain-containing protein